MMSSKVLPSPSEQETTAERGQALRRFQPGPGVRKNLFFVDYLLNSAKFSLELGRLTWIQGSSQRLVSRVALMVASGIPLM